MPSPSLIPTNAYFSRDFVALDNREWLVDHKQVLLPVSETEREREREREREIR